MSKQIIIMTVHGTWNRISKSFNLDNYSCFEISKADFL